MGLCSRCPMPARHRPACATFFKELENETGTQRSQRPDPLGAAGRAAAEHRADGGQTAPFPTPSRAGAFARPRWNTPCSKALPLWPLRCAVGQARPKYAPVFAAVQDRRPCWCWNRPTPAPLSAVPWVLWVSLHPLVKINAFCSSTEKQAIDWLK